MATAYSSPPSLSPNEVIWAVVSARRTWSAVTPPCGSVQIRPLQ